MPRPERLEWTVALVTAGLLHVAVGLAADAFWFRTDTGAEAQGIGGIEIALGPAGGVPGGQAAAAQTPDTEDTPEDTATEAVEEPAESQTPGPVEQTVPVEIEKAPDPVVRQPLPDPASKPAPAQPNTVVSEATVTASTPSAPGAGGKAGSQQTAEAGASTKDASAGGMSGAETDYAALVLAWLEKHKEYPPRARMRREEGIVVLYFVIDRQGGVLESRVEESSGRALLDRAALDMLERASPLPALPEDMPQARLEMLVPVQFFITD